MNNKKLPLNKWSDDDKPREKMITLGKKALSNSELIGILIGSGNKEESAIELSKRILHSVNESLNELSKLNVHDLINHFKGIGEAKAVSIMAAMELGYRLLSEKQTFVEYVKTSQNAFDCICSSIVNLNYEEFWAIFLNNNNKVLYKQRISIGGITQASVDCRIILKTAIEKNATAIILAHNHPSGNITPSESDKNLTKKLLESCSLLDIKVLDHIILGTGMDNPNAYFSFLDQDLLR